MTDLEQKFTEDMVNIYKTAKKECGYVPTRFLQLVGSKGGLVAAKQLISKPGGTDGFSTLWECGRLDLSVEAHVIKPEYASLFTVDEVKACKDRLTEYGYKVD